MSNGDDSTSSRAGTNSGPEIDFNPDAPNGVLWIDDVELPSTAGSLAVYYVYVWWHGNIPRYVGQGCDKRWQAHRYEESRNPRKTAYFKKHWDEMECYAVAEILTKIEARQLENNLIKKYGLLGDGGTLLNINVGKNAAYMRGKISEPLSLDDLIDAGGPIVLVHNAAAQAAAQTAHTEARRWLNRLTKIKTNASSDTVLAKTIEDYIRALRRIVGERPGIDEVRAQTRERVRRFRERKRKA
jgi:hypothetical protein